MMSKIGNKKKGFTPLEKAADFSRRLLPHKADGGLKPPSAQTVNPVRKLFSNGIREPDSSLTGFTLIEAMIATAVLALSALLVHEAFFISLNAYNYYHNYMNIVSFADEKMWQAQDDLTHFGALTSVEEKGDLAKGGKNFVWNLSSSSILDTENHNLYMIDLSLFWQEGGRPAVISRTAFAIYEKK